jgi:hypothetical protein
MNARGRKVQGQAIAEGTAMISLTVTIFVLLVMFGMNLYTMMQTDMKLIMIAYEAAKMKGSSQYWLGFERYQPPTDAQVAQQAANLAKTFGITLDPATAFTFSVPPTRPNNLICTVKLDKLSLPYGTGVFASFNNRFQTASAEVVCDGKSPPPGIGAITLADSRSNQCRVFFFPMYGCNTIKNNTWGPSQLPVPSLNSLTPAWNGVVPVVNGTAVAAGNVVGNGSQYGEKDWTCITTADGQTVDSLNPGVYAPGVPWY